MFAQHNMAKRRLVLVAGAVYAFTRGIAYVPAVRDAPVQEPLVAATGGLDFVLWLYIGAWCAAGVACLWKLRSGDLVVPMASVVGLMVAWGAAWFLGWLAHPYTVWWQTAFTYWGPAAIIAGELGLTMRRRKGASRHGG